VIHVDAFVIQDVATGRFLTLAYRGGAGPSRYWPTWVEDMNDASLSFYGVETSEARVDSLLEDFDGNPDPGRTLWSVRIPVSVSHEWSAEHDMRRWRAADPIFYEMIVRKARRPCCECCGGNPWGYGPRRRWVKIQEVDDGTWRCEKHLGRNPCAIEGCGKTRANRRPSSDDHLCGAHWKFTPQVRKLIYRKLWRLAKKNARKGIGDRQGFTPELNARYWRNWHRLIQETRLAVHPPALEIQPSSGPPPAALLAELERIGL
jgi:hypothetical protein